MTSAADSTTDEEVVVMELGPEYGVISEELIAPLQALFEKQFRDTVPQLLIIDLSLVRWFCSSFLGLLADWWKRLTTRGDTRTAVCGLDASLRDRLVATRLVSLWPIFNTMDEALAAPRAGD